MDAADAREFAALGLYDPDAPHADERLQLLRLLRARGATIEEVTTWADALPELASRLTVRPAGGRTSLRAMTAALDLPLEGAQRLWRAFGFPEPDPDDLVVPAALDETGLSIAEANFALGELIEPFTQATRLLLRMHIEQAMRPSSELDVDRLRGYEERVLAIGFADLTGSTRLAGSLSFAELGDAISEFEDIVADAVGRGRGRLVKLIGDEVMFAVSDPAAACRIALDITRAVGERSALPQVRAGIGHGRVLVRYGDCFGPVVNRASRLLDVAEPGTVVVDDDVVRAIGPDAGLRFESLGERLLRGIAEPVTVTRVEAVGT